MPLQKPQPVRLQNEGQRLLVLSGLSLHNLAKACEVTSAAVVKWRKGTGLPRPMQRAKLFELYEIPIDSWLQPPNSQSDAIVYNASGATPEIDRPDRERYTGKEAVEIPPYPDAPHEDATTLEHMKHLLACIRHDKEHLKLTQAATSKLRADEQRALTLIARLEAQAEMQEDRFVRSHPEWKRLRDIILRALKPYPDASRAVLEAIEEQSI
jgi:transcriptional regulator with XRE-family HTH domain